jgi:formylglycine-generating enzyme required for sulfatase activity/chromosome segregation ATPase/CRP-like cAMP-binding protein
MGAAKKLIDKKVLRDLVPINALSAMHLEEISRKAVIEEVRSGTYVFKKGDRDAQTVYLLDGEVELVDERRDIVDTVTAGTETGFHPLAHQQPRQLGARAAGKVTVARVDSSLLDVLLTWDESAGYDVVEIDAEDDDDWMTRMLQSQAFLQLPPSNIHQLLMRLEAIDADAGEVIVRQGDEGDYFYIVKSGRLAVTRKASPTSKDVLLAELGEGACFGEEALVSEAKRNASVVMLTEGSLMRLSKDDFNELLCASLVHETDFEGAQTLVSKGAKWLDVRLPGEFENQAVKGSVNLPLSALREQCSEMDRGTDYIVCCDTGRRSAAGAFVLSQRGFNVYTLKNGLMGVPAEELISRLRGETAASSRDADILPFEAENRPDAPAETRGAGRHGQDTPADIALIDRIAAAESDKLALQQQLEQLKAQLAGAEDRVKTAEAAQQEHQSRLQAFKQEVGSIGAQLAERDRQFEQRSAEAAQEKKRLEDELAAAREGLEAGRTRLETADSERSIVQEELTRLQQTLSQIEASAEGRDDALRQELERMAEHLKTEQQRYDKQTRDLEDELGRLRNDYQQLGQRTSAVAGERDAANQELKEVTQQLDTLHEQLNSGQSESREALEKLQQSLSEREQAFAAEQTEAQRLRVRLEEVEADYRKIEQQMNAATEQEAGLASQASELQARLDDSAREREELEASLQGANQQLEASQGALQEAREQLQQQRSDAAGEVQELSGQIADLQHQLEQTSGEIGAERDALAQRVEQLQQELEAGQQEREQLEQARDAAASEKDGLAGQLQTAQQALEEQQQQVAAGQAEREALERQLAEAQAQISEQAGHERQLQEQLQALGKQQEEHSAGLASSESELNQLREKHADAERRNRELETKLVSLGQEHKSDLTSAREAISRAQTETENVQREQTRLMASLRKAERNLENERHDHESEVYRLRKQLKDAAGESNAGLAAEMEALQSKLKEDSRARDDLEIKLGERSAQLEDVQAEVDRIKVQLQHAQESARQAEQQLLESSQTANEEMAVRMEAEEKAQQGLRTELAQVIGDRNRSREQLTVQTQELDELRAALEAAQQAEAARQQDGREALEQLHRERDEALERLGEFQQQVDQLRAEAEVTRGLVDMQSPAGVDAALREQLEQAKKNVDVAVRLRSQAEEKNAELQVTIERLRAQLQEADRSPGAHIPSLDENDPQAAALLNPTYPDTDPEPARATLVDEEGDAPSAVPAAAVPLAAEKPSGGGLKSLVGSILIGSVLAGGGLWWWLQQAPAVSPTAAAGTRVDEPGAEPPNEAHKHTEAAHDRGTTAEQAQPAHVPAQMTSGADTAASTEPGTASGQAAASVAGATTPARIRDFTRGSTTVATTDAAETTPARAVPATAPQASTREQAPQDAAPEATQVTRPRRTYSEPLNGGGRAPVLVEFQASGFDMGSGVSSANFDERPRHRVQLKAFAISKQEVTFAEYGRFARATGRSVPGDNGWGRGERPVINVRWQDALAYTQWLSEQTGSRYRLPTEAEWEFAARSGSDARFWWGNETGKAHANCFDCGSEWSGQKTAPVGSFSASQFGLQDMAGNVMEWVQDCYQPDYSSAPADGSAVSSGDCSRRVVRGGAYDSPSENLRSASRDARDADTRLDNLGFRVVKE